MTTDKMYRTTYEHLSTDEGHYVTRLYLLTDYKGVFGSKVTAVPYRSGFDKAKLSAALCRHDLRPTYLPLANVNFRRLDFAGELVVYTSAEDEGAHYKSYIEDVVLGLQLQGARLIPRFECLRAHHNKVFMEILRDTIDCADAKSLATQYFGTWEDLRVNQASVRTPVVVKPAAGSMSAGVRLARDRGELFRLARSASHSNRVAPRARDLARRIRRPGYMPESWHRRKFVVQEFVPDLDHDWKVLVYGTKLFAMRRAVRRGDFRASGSGAFSWPEDVPPAVLEVSLKLARALDVPWLSVDAIVTGDRAHIIEFQALYFGTIAIESAPGYFIAGDRGWEFRRAKSTVEDEFAAALADHVRAAATRRDVPNSGVG